MPASRARARAVSSLWMRAACSCGVFGSQLKNRKICMSSIVSMSPLLSLSNRANKSWNCWTFSSEKLAFFLCRSTSSTRQESTIDTKPSKSIPCEGKAPFIFKRSRVGVTPISLSASNTLLFGNSPLTSPSCAVATDTLLNLDAASCTLDEDSLSMKKASAYLVNSLSLQSLINRRNSLKSSWPLSLESTSVTKTWMSSWATLYPRCRNNSASSRPSTSPDPSASNRVKTLRISSTSACVKPSRWRKVSMNAKNSLKSNSSPSLHLRSTTSEITSSTFCRNGV
mmetsp:Transcript_105059/g.321999  ORF Transcript_105059/g.321999 Transcript_105059/m.321999 type:complete len:283 (+) Transcript_105059:583-1431(+)